MRTFCWMLVAALGLAVPAGAQSQRAGDRSIEAAWAALEKGDGSAASGVFQDAIARNPRDASLHFGAGYALYLLGRNQDAAERLNRALTLDPRLHDAAVILSDIEYAQGDLKGAIARLEKVLPSAGPLAPAIRRRLATWRKAAEVDSGLAVRDGARFSIAFNGQSDNFLATHATSLIDRAYSRITERLGAYPSKRINVTLYSEQQFRDVTDAPAWSGGLFDGRISIPVKGAAQNVNEFDRVVVHELTHAIVADLAVRGVPTWLHEGLAGYFEGRDPDEALRQLQSINFSVPLSYLEGPFGGLNPSQAAVAYRESLVAADMLMRQAGPRIAVVLQALGRGQTFGESLAQIGLQASEFEAQVMRRLRR